MLKGSVIMDINNSEQAKIAETAKEVKMVDQNKLKYLRGKLNLSEDMIAINAGTWGPLCEAARLAMKALDDKAAKIRHTDSKEFMTEMVRALDEDRNAIAKFINCSPEEVALCESTTTAMNIFLWGYEFGPGDEIVTGSLENPGAWVPFWVIAKRRNLKLSFADLGKNGEKDATEAIQKAISDKTKMIVISDVDYATGHRVDLKAISQIAHERGILVLADGIQAIAASPVDVRELEVDGYALARHKFTCGPDGAGALYVKKGILDQINPTFSGLFSDSEHGMSGKLVVENNAKRFDISTRPFYALVGGTAAVKWFDEKVGWDFVFERTCTLRTKMWDYLSDIKGVHIHSPRVNGGGLITFYIDGMEPQEIIDALKPRKIISRTIIVTEPPAVRISIGCWNRDSDLEAISRAIEELAKKK